MSDFYSRIEASRAARYENTAADEPDDEPDWTLDDERLARWEADREDGWIDASEDDA